MKETFIINEKRKAKKKKETIIINKQRNDTKKKRRKHLSYDRKWAKKKKVGSTYHLTIIHTQIGQVHKLPLPKGSKEHSEHTRS